MRPKPAPEQLLTIEEFLALTESRPQEERWELIEGIAIMNPSPTKWHQVIASNIAAKLVEIANRHDNSWIPALGVGTRVPVSPRSLPQPDVMVFEHPLEDEALPVSDDAIVLFEVLTPSNTKSDQAWRRRVYSSIPNCQHYVTVSQKSVLVTRFDRTARWEPVELKNPKDALALPALGGMAVIPLADIYRWTPLGKP